MLVIRRSGGGSPVRRFDALVARGVKQLAFTSDVTTRLGVGVGKLIEAGCVARVIALHIGTNPTTQQQMISREIVVKPYPTPQGAFDAMPTAPETSFITPAQTRHFVCSACGSCHVRRCRIGRRCGRRIDDERALVSRRPSQTFER